MVNPLSPNSYLLTPSQKGFALLFAMFVSSIMLSIGLGISNVIYKELVLSGIGRESEYSLYTAQTGLECALYINSIHPTVFPTFAAEPGAELQPADTCAGSLINREDGVNYTYSPVGTGATTTFSIRILPPESNPSSQPMCANIQLYKSASNYIIVESRGYNTCDDQNPRRVERSLKLRSNVVPDSGT